ncbi:hypothetical protein FOA52_001225 [Chlamydomonas sp. UWO 241]|nr:hypothetical protein FOA52_001225 [Chlamydomonas sp. UWO 241]
MGSAGHVVPSVRCGEAAPREVVAFMLDHGGHTRVPTTCLVRAAHSSLKNGPNVAGVPKLATLIEFVENKCDAVDMGSEFFATDDAHRIAMLDIRLLNTDRHSGIILMKQRTNADGIAGPPTPDSAVSDYVLIPIDHRCSLPEVLAEPFFEWMSWPQAKQPFSEKNLLYIASLDAEADVHLLCKRMPGLHPGSLRMLELMTALLKHYAQAGKTLYEIGILFERPNDGSPSPLELMCLRARAWPAEALALFGPDLTAALRAAPLAPMSDEDGAVSKYVLIPIDHGFSLPEALGAPNFAWLHWPQAKQPFSEKELSHIASLDAEADVRLLRECLPRLRPGSLRLLELMTVLLKHYAQARKTLYEYGILLERPNDISSASATAVATAIASGDSSAAASAIASAAAEGGDGATAVAEALAEVIAEGGTSAGAASQAVAKAYGKDSTAVAQALSQALATTGGQIGSQAGTSLLAVPVVIDQIEMRAPSRAAFALALLLACSTLAHGRVLMADASASASASASARSKGGDATAVAKAIADASGGGEAQAQALAEAIASSKGGGASAVAESIAQAYAADPSGTATALAAAFASAEAKGDSKAVAQSIAEACAQVRRIDRHCAQCDGATAVAEALAEAIAEGGATAEAASQAVAEAYGKDSTAVAQALSQALATAGGQASGFAIAQAAAAGGAQAQAYAEAVALAVADGGCKGPIAQALAVASAEARAAGKTAALASALAAASAEASACRLRSSFPTFGRLLKA